MRDESDFIFRDPFGLFAQSFEQSWVSFIFSRTVDHECEDVLHVTDKWVFASNVDPFGFALRFTTPPDDDNDCPCLATRPNGLQVLVQSKRIRAAAEAAKRAEYVAIVNATEALD